MASAVVTEPPSGEQQPSKEDDWSPASENSFPPELLDMIRPRQLRVIDKIRRDVNIKLRAVRAFKLSLLTAFRSGELERVVRSMEIPDQAERSGTEDLDLPPEPADSGSAPELMAPAVVTEPPSGEQQPSKATAQRSLLAAFRSGELDEVVRSMEISDQAERSGKEDLVLPPEHADSGSAAELVAPAVVTEPPSGEQQPRKATARRSLLAAFRSGALDEVVRGMETAQRANGRVGTSEVEEVLAEASIPDARQVDQADTNAAVKIQSRYRGVQAREGVSSRRASAVYVETAVTQLAASMTFELLHGETATTSAAADMSFENVDIESGATQVATELNFDPMQLESATARAATEMNIEAMSVETAKPEAATAKRLSVDLEAMSVETAKPEAATAK